MLAKGRCKYLAPSSHYRTRANFDLQNLDPLWWVPRLWQNHSFSQQSWLTAKCCRLPFFCVRGRTDGTYRRSVTHFCIFTISQHPSTFSHSQILLKNNSCNEISIDNYSPSQTAPASDAFHSWSLSSLYWTWPHRFSLQLQVCTTPLPNSLSVCGRPSLSLTHFTLHF